MRAAISHKFGRDYGLGTQQWMEHPTIPGKWIGNPSLSVVVSQYMVSLRRRKVRSGEAITSARAMDMATMRQLYDFLGSVKPKEYGPTPRKRKAENPSEWAGQRIRKMLYLLYLVSMLCLLRFDEVLRITWADVVFQVRDLSVSNHWQNTTPERLAKLRPEHFRIQLNLPFRKTHQYGGIAPFYLYADQQRPWMCPLRAFAIWWIIAQQQNEQLDGFVFRKRTSAAFLECFRNNLLDIGVDPRPYGTHSFRRGGCQYLHTVLKWPFRQICAWGGWAENFDNPGTIFKYLLSWNDNPDHEREELMNPNRPGTDPCFACGRTCHCA
ncbi:hypothetical protein L210DRAFT_3660271 [Boletus edulis BED1]|uniref:DNA breaking-rejoining enzyme n=1 Tax=Boletus edulis BED1 TaxID=1328754 RepID=A0AAD4BNR2_BOLED|nr:hypothetical protein L210DRAFT_3615994 [Boletus edulis BED1]KAF8435302.1 hypothetical protein L210DRAFT_3613593 [Boletus edulis BED1]KAF8452190.1 hypothetical protein L210DRAFT_3660271 [Boletus edulis BED1]